MPLMSVLIHPQSTRESKIVQGDEGAFASFFLNKTEQKDEVVTFDRSVVQRLEVYRGQVGVFLREAFDPLVKNNNRGLEKIMINDHGAAHMERVASASYQLGKKLGFPEADLQAMALSTSLHDVGYRFPHDVESPAVNPKDYTKESQDPHPIKGANYFAERLDDLRRDNPDIEREVQWWNSSHDEIAHRAIRHHSNGSDYHPELLSGLVKLPRMMDKLDNSHERVFASHAEGIRAMAKGASIQEVQNQVRSTAHTSLGHDKFLSLEDALHEARTFDARLEHRVVPFAIIDQYLHVDPQTFGCSMHYAVDIGRAQSLLGPDYSSREFLGQFEAAYAKSSMRRAAEVAHSIQRYKGQEKAADAASLKVHFHFSDGTRATKEYAPRFD